MDSMKYRIDLIKLLPNNPVTVELGVAEGNFSLDILREWKPKKHYLVDNWGPINDITGDGTNPQVWHDKNYLQTVQKVNDYKNIEILRGITWEMANFVDDNSIDIVYIDACHSYECVMKDIESWIPKVKKGGIMAFHDYLSMEYGVNQAVNEFAGKNGFSVNVIEENNTFDAGAWFRV